MARLFWVQFNDTVTNTLVVDIDRKFFKFLALLLEITHSVFMKDKMAKIRFIETIGWALLRYLCRSQRTQGSWGRRRCFCRSAQSARRPSLEKEVQSNYPHKQNGGKRSWTWWMKESVPIEIKSWLWWQKQARVFCSTLLGCLALQKRQILILNSCSILKNALV